MIVVLWQITGLRSEASDLHVRYRWLFRLWHIRDVRH